METPSQSVPVKPKRRWLLVVVIIVILVVVAVGGLYAYQYETTVNVTGVVWEIQQGSSAPIPSSPQAGFTASTGSQSTVHFNWDYSICGVPCKVETVSNVTVETSEFSLVSSNCPLTIQPLSWGVVSVTVKAPDSAYSGQLVIYISIY